MPKMAPRLSLPAITRALATPGIGLVTGWMTYDSHFPAIGLASMRPSRTSRSMTRHFPSVPAMITFAPRALSCGAIAGTMPVTRPMSVRRSFRARITPGKSCASTKSLAAAPCSTSGKPPETGANTIRGSRPITARPVLVEMMKHDTTKSSRRHQRFWKRRLHRGTDNGHETKREVMEAIRRTRGQGMRGSEPLQRRLSTAGYSHSVHSRKSRTNLTLDSHGGRKISCRKASQGRALQLRLRPGDSRQLDLHPPAAGLHVAGVVEGGNGIGEREMVGDERAHVEFAATQQGKGAGIDMGVTEDGFDARLLDLGRHDVKRHRRARHADEHGAAAGAKHVDRLRRGLGHSGGFKDDVGPPAAGRRPHDLAGILLPDVDRCDRTKRGCEGELGRLHVGDEYPAAAGQARPRSHAWSDHTGAEHDRHVAGLEPRFAGGVQADSQGLDHRALPETHVVGQLEGECLRVHHGRAQAAVHGRRRPEAHRWIEVVESEPGRAAVRIGNPGLHADAVAETQRCHGRAGFLHHAGGLVSEHHRRAHDKGADGAMLVIVHVAAAYADRVNPDADIMRTERFVDRDLPQAEQPGFLQDESLHDEMKG